MKLNAYLGFNGQCEAAFKYYEQCLGGKITEMMTYSQAPEGAMGDQFPAEWSEKIMHVSMTVGDQEIMGSDNPPGFYEEGKNIYISIGLNDPAEAERVFNSLAENGEIRMPLQQTFWAQRFGMVIDQFGTPWMVNCDQTVAA